MLHKCLKLAMALSLCLLFFSHSTAEAGHIPVFVSIAPQKYFVQQIGGPLVDIQVMVEPGASPHTYEPKPRQMADLAKTKAYFSIGVEFEEAWLPRISAANRQMKIIAMDDGIIKRPMTVHRHHEGDPRDPEPETGHHHDQDAHHHDHGRPDPHIWLSPRLVKVQARNVLVALQEIDPHHRTVYAANYERFVSALDALDEALKNIFAGNKNLRFMVFHPAWGYFAEAYGLEQIPIEVEGKDPKPAQLKALIKQARAENIRIIFAQPQFSTKSAEMVAREIGGQVVFADPLAEDWTANMREVAAKFEAALR